jgi:predicted alpha/beta hydrolase family esterase
MLDWCDPRRETWVAAIDEAVAAHPTPPTVIAHSLGCIATVHWAQRRRRPVRAALLVAPADVECRAALADFAPLPREPLPFPSAVVTSDDDPYIALDRAAGLAADWRSDLHVIARGGHLNAASKLGSWPRGRSVLAGLLSTFHLDSADGDRSAGCGPEAFPRQRRAR